MSPPAGDPPQRRAERTALRLVGWLAVAAHVLLGVPSASLGLVVPVLAYLALLVLWAALLVVVWRLRRDRPLAALLVPAGYLLVVVAVVTAGGALLGWTA